jgi:DNA-binding beta-propeller fold protein YncE
VHRVLGSTVMDPRSRPLRLRRGRVFSTGAAIAIGLVAIGLAGCSSGVAADGAEAHLPTPKAGSQLAYVVSQLGIVPVNLSKGLSEQPLKTPSSLLVNGQFSSFADLAVSPNGKSAYVLSPAGMVRIDLATGDFGKPLPMTSQFDAISMDPNGRTVYLTGGNHSNGIVPVSTSSGLIRASIPVPGDPVGLAIAKNGRTAYVITNGGAQITPVGLSTGLLGSPIKVPDGVGDLAIAPNGTTAYATGNLNMAEGNRTYSFVTPIDLRSGFVGAPIRMLHAPYGIVLSPGGSTAYVTGGGGPGVPAITSIDLATGQTGSTIRVPGGASEIASAAE